MTIHHVYANRSNIGDWLSARGIQRLLARPVREHLCDDPFVAQTLAELADTTADDLILIGGGGLLMDYFDPFWKGLAEIDTAATTCWWGLGCVDLKAEDSLPKGPVHELARRAEVCVVRDELSRGFLGIDTPPVPCPSLAAEYPPRDGLCVLHVANYDTVGAENYEVMVEIVDSFAERRGVGYRETNNRIADRPLAFEECIGRYAQSEVVVSSGLHGCIIGVAMGAKVIAVSGDRKIDEFMVTAGLSDWLLSRDDVERLPSLLERIDTQDDRSSFLAAAIEQNRAVADLIRRHVR